MPANTSIIREHSSLIEFGQKIIDLAAIFASGVIAYWIVLPNFHVTTPYRLAIILGLLIAFIVFRSFKLYKSWRGISLVTELASVFAAWSIGVTVLALVIYTSEMSGEYTRNWLLCWWLSGLVTLSVMRYVVRTGLKVLRAKGYNQRSVLVIGSGSLGEMVVHRLEDSITTGFQVRNSYLLPEQADIHSEDFKHALQSVREHQADQIWVAMPLSNSGAIQAILDALVESTADIRLVPDMFALKMMNQSLGVVAGLPVINLSVTPMDGINRLVKAIQDGVLAALILLLVSPLFALIAIGIKLGSPGPVFYRQKRLSWNGKPFKIYKFRTMPVNVEANSGAVWASSGEQRATRVGRFLRRTSLDELPQFINVLQGDMSIVGPRPERPEFVHKFKSEIPGYMQKHKVKAGITGWAQVNGWRGDTCLRTRIAHDLEYIRRWSLWFDLKIILLTIFKGFLHKNAY